MNKKFHILLKKYNTINNRSMLQIINIIKNNCNINIIQNKMSYLICINTDQNLMDLIAKYSSNNNYIINQCERLIKTFDYFNYTDFFIAIFNQSNMGFNRLCGQ